MEHPHEITSPKTQNKRKKQLPPFTEAQEFQKRIRKCILSSVERDFGGGWDKRIKERDQTP